MSLLSLPDEILGRIACCLDARSIVALASSCKTLRDPILANQVVQSLLVHDFGLDVKVRTV